MNQLFTVILYVVEGDYIYGELAQELFKMGGHHFTMWITRDSYCAVRGTYRWYSIGTVRTWSGCCTHHRATYSQASPELRFRVATDSSPYTNGLSRTSRPSLSF